MAGIDKIRDLLEAKLKRQQQAVDLTKAQLEELKTLSKGK